jgi:hypothetical protein
LVAVPKIQTLNGNGFFPLHASRKKRIQNHNFLFNVGKLNLLIQEQHFASSFIKLLKEVAISISSLNFKFINMSKSNASFNDQ